MPVLERPGTTRIGRFGHKGQQASLLSFSADAYLNEMGITSPLQPNENTSNGRAVVEPITRPGPGRRGRGRRAVRAVHAGDQGAAGGPRHRATPPDAQAGSTIFATIGCAVCHTPTITTEPPGTLINGGALKVANAVGNKNIHPFSDFLLHDIGTGDGIVQNGGRRRATRSGPRRSGACGRAAGSCTTGSASPGGRHRAPRQPGGAARANFNALGTTSKNRVLKFLSSL